ncbi:hypothetical protein EON65_24880 [archaeon]|nr:MAG: hypothetical protein EON65_24880 [archaeon]
MRILVSKVFIFLFLIGAAIASASSSSDCTLQRRNMSLDIDYNNQPIIAIGLPKSGTTSLHAYLKSIHPSIHSGHQELYEECPSKMFPIPAITLDDGNSTWSKISTPDPSFVKNKVCPFAFYIQKAIADGKKPFDYLQEKGLNTFAQLDVITYDHPRFPQLDVLDRIIDAYPNAFFIHHIREVNSHVSSIMRWGTMYERLKESGALRNLNQSNKAKTTQELLAEWIMWSREHIRSKFLERPGVRYLEVDLEAAENMAASSISIFVGARCIHKVEQKNQNTDHPAPNH